MWIHLITQEGDLRCRPLPIGPAAENKQTMAAIVPYDEEAAEEAVTAAEEGSDVASLVKHLITATAAANETVVEAALDAVLRLSKQSPALKASLGEAGAPAALVAACAALQDEPSVCEVALSCIASLATDSPANQAAFGDGDSAAALGELLVACMEAHGADEPTVQEWGCLAAEALAKGCPANAEALSAAGVEAAVTSAKELITNERNKTYPDRALAALASA